MGDVILIAPLIDYLRKKHPEASIVLLTLHNYAALFKDDIRLNSVIGVRRGEITSDIEGQWDSIIDLQNNRRSRKQIRSLSAARICRISKLRLKRFILLLSRINCYTRDATVVHRYYQASGAIPPYGVPDFSIPFDGSKTRRLLPFIQHGEITRPTIALFPFSAWRNKEWPVEYFTSVGHFFLVKGWNVVLLGGKADRERADAMQEKIGYRSVSFAGRLDLYECGSLLKHCNLALGCDTGLSHLARACGIKSGFIFGPTTWHFGFQPQNDPDCRIFEVKRFCRPCHPHGGNICVRFDHGCMTKLTPEMVISGLMELYHG